MSEKEKDDEEMTPEEMAKKLKEAFELAFGEEFEVEFIPPPTKH